MDGTGFSFPLPSQIEDVPGAEGWRSMYQYFTRFQPEDDNRFWFNNAMHFPEPLPAFDVLTCEIPYAAIGANTARIFAFPTTLGIEHRILNGRVYITAIPVTDPAEIERRLTGCRVRLVGKPSLDALRAPAAGSAFARRTWRSLATILTWRCRWHIGDARWRSR
jgi:hypothetical protein